jgi:type III restriction enzyme
VKTAIYQFLEKEHGLEKYSSEAQKIVLGKENVQAFVDCINLSKEQYKTTVVQQLSEKRELQEVEKWEVPMIISYNSRYKQGQYPSSVMSPLYLKNPSEPEQKFMEWLSDPKNKVKWWFKNGEKEIKYFAVLYEDENGKERGFYLDFVVMFQNGTLGLFDTKSGITAKDAGPRAEGLHKYIVAENKKGKKLWGGILIYVNGTWRYNDEKKYHYDPTDLSNWKVLSI